MKAASIHVVQVSNRAGFKRFDKFHLNRSRTMRWPRWSDDRVILRLREVNNQWKGKWKMKYSWIYYCILLYAAFAGYFVVVKDGILYEM